MTDTIETLRRLHAEYVEACGPFKPYMGRSTPNEMTLSTLQRVFETTMAVELPKLLACAEAMESVEKNLGAYIDYKGAVDVNIAIAFEEARAALASLKESA